jgi:hypothetical protein
VHEENERPLTLLEIRKSDPVRRHIVDGLAHAPIYRAPRRRRPALAARRSRVMLLSCERYCIGFWSPRACFCFLRRVTRMGPRRLRI